MRGLLPFVLLAAAALAVGCGSSASSHGAAKHRYPAGSPTAVTKVQVFGNPATMVSAFGGIWAIGHRTGGVYDIDPRTARTLRLSAIGGTYYLGLAPGDGALFTLSLIHI